jgi:hypothetical protein
MVTPVVPRDPPTRPGATPAPASRRGPLLVVGVAAVAAIAAILYFLLGS